MAKHKHKWKYQINIKKKLIVLVVLGVVLFVGLGYAIIGSNLNIFGTLDVAKYDKTLYGALQKEVRKGYALKYTGEHQDSMDASKSTEDIYHFYADTDAKGSEILNKNNVLFANICWQMIRTTDTGGVRLLYNGDPEIIENNGEIQYNCGNTGKKYRIGDIESVLNLSGTYLYAKNYVEVIGGSKSFVLVDDPNDPNDTYSVSINSSNAAEQIEYIAKNYPYTCRNTSGTCNGTLTSSIENFYKVGGYSSGTNAKVYSATAIDSIGESKYNSNNNSPAYVGYMYGDVYEYKKFNSRATQTFTNGSMYISPSSASISSNMQNLSINNQYYYASSIEWDTLDNPNKYTLVSPTQIDDSTDYSTLIGKYIIGNATVGTSVYYVLGISNTTAYVKVLSNGNNDIYMAISDELTSSLDALDNPTMITLSEYYNNYTNYKEKYVCGGSSTTCSSPHFITSPTKTSYTYISGKFTIAKSRNGLDLVDYETIDYGKWYRGATTTYADYKYTCRNANTTCTTSNMSYIIENKYQNAPWILIYDITIAKSRNGLNLDDYITITTDQWAKEYNTTYADYKYTCGNADTVCAASDLKYIVTKYQKSFSYKLNYNFGSSVIYEDGKYKLQDVKEIEYLDNLDVLSTHHYFCIDVGATECENIGYFYGYVSFEANYYILISDPNILSINDALDAMFKKNTIDSIAKTNIDKWYERYLKDTVYESKIEDTIYCNDRSYDTTSGYTFNESGWNDNGGNLKKNLFFKEFHPTKDISCSNVTDRFSVSNNQAKLKYPVALMSTPDLNLLNNLKAREHVGYSMLMSPANAYTQLNFSSSMTWSTIRGLPNNGNLALAYANSIAEGTDVSTKSLTIRPAISLVKDIKYSGGNGTMTNPYVVKPDNGWVLVNNKIPMSNQKFEYWLDGEKIMSGWRDLTDFSGNPNTYYFKDGYSYHGWLELDGNKYYLSTFDDDGNGYLDGRRFNSETREIDGVNYTFDENGVCTNC